MRNFRGRLMGWLGSAALYVTSCSDVRGCQPSSNPVASPRLHQNDHSTAASAPWSAQLCLRLALELQVLAWAAWLKRASRVAAPTAFIGECQYGICQSQTTWEYPPPASINHLANPRAVGTNTNHRHRIKHITGA